jgi:hypothetical protein
MAIIEPWTATMTQFDIPKSENLNHVSGYGWTF